MVGKYVFLQTMIKGELLFVSMGFSHGGLVDRLKGIISFYEVAKSWTTIFIFILNIHLSCQVFVNAK
jgi:hypothetical protein